MPTSAPVPAAHPFIVMNPRSGGGKVVRFDLAAKAQALGAEVAVLDGPGYVDVAALVRDAVDRGADLLGVAGGDGTQALVAGIAADHDIPLLVISAGTRNHFALDLGLDRDDPSTCLQALTDGEEVRVDLGIHRGPAVREQRLVRRLRRDRAEPGVPGQQEPHHAGDAARPARRAAGRGPDRPHRRPARWITCRRCWSATTPTAPGRVLDLGRRARLDQGTLGVIAARMASTGQAVGLLRRAQYRSVTRYTAPGEVIIHAGTATIPVGIDGEAVTVPTPVHCTIRPRALRVLLPRTRPGVPPPRPRIDWQRLWQIAFAQTPRRPTG